MGGRLLGDPTALCAPPTCRVSKEARPHGCARPPGSATPQRSGTPGLAPTAARMRLRRLTLSRYPRTVSTLCCRVWHILRQCSRTLRRQLRREAVECTLGEPLCGPIDLEHELVARLPSHEAFIRRHDVRLSSWARAHATKTSQAVSFPCGVAKDSMGDMLLPQPTAHYRPLPSL